MTDATEVVAEAAEAVAEEAAHVAQVARRLPPREIKIALVAVAGGALAGALVSHFVTKRREQAKAEEHINVELESVRAHYRAKDAMGKPDLEELAERYRSGEGPTDGAVAEAVVTRLEEARVRVEPSSNGQTDYHNVFEDPKQVEYIEAARASEQWDYATEVKLRTPEEPYIIHKDEVGEMVREKDYADVTYTFFEEDGILMGERDEVIDNQDGLVGLANLDRFGHGSGDVNVVYVRNDKYQMEIRIQRSGGSYATEVHGFPHDDEIGSHRTSRRFDDDDGSD